MVYGSERWEASERRFANQTPDLLHEVFEATADRFPDHVAADFGGEEVTYRTLDQRASEIAAALSRAGVRRGARAAVLLLRSPDLYAAMLGALKVGAAYVPLDPSFPAERMRFIMGDCGADAIITTTEALRAAGLSGAEGLPRAICLDTGFPLGSAAHAPLERNGGGAEPSDASYVIYTSGTTGRPKGVEVAHASICHWIRAAESVYGVLPTDRIYQGFSVAFDASLEEIWMAFANGATLVPATPAMAQAGPELPRLLTEAQVTILSCVPTLVSMFDSDMPTVRLLIFGGEACPRALADRWCAPGRRVLNTYGPTEATVTATAAELAPGRPVTLGSPLPGYTVLVLDEEGRQVPRGGAGEIHIGGVGVARGYINRDDLTRERFVPDRMSGGLISGARLYKTGDLARISETGDLEFLGRTDGQVKIRGFRVELPEIEEQLLEIPGVAAAAVGVHEATPGISSLVAYVVPRSGAPPPDVTHFDERLRERLPPYMMPAAYEVLPALPMLPSGKVDRAKLPAPTGARAARQRVGRAPEGDAEIAIAAVWAPMFGHSSVSASDDFFLDLGGHSLFAATAASKLRGAPGFESVSVADIYRNPTVEKLARAVDPRPEGAPVPSHTGAAGPPAAVSPLVVRPPVPAKLHRRAGAAQAAGVYAIQILVFYPLLLMGLAAGRGAAPVSLALLAIVAAVTYFPIMIGVSLAAKWLVIGRYRAGRYPLWGGYYLRWWFVRHVNGLLPLQWISGTPLMRGYCRLMGARIGKDVHLDTVFFQAFDLVTIGDNSSVNLDAQLTGYTVEGGELVIGPINIGRSCVIGAHSVVGPGTTMRDGAVLAEHSLLAPGATAEPGTFYAGSPAEQQAELPPGYFPPGDPLPPAPRARRAAITCGHLASAGLLALIPLAASLPGALLFARLWQDYGALAALAASPIIAVLFISSFILLTAAVKWTLLGRAKPGWHPVWGGLYLRKWFVDRVLHLNFLFLNSLFSTLYALAYIRLLGAKLGPNAEIERVSHVAPDLLTLKSGSFIADAVYLGAPRAAQGRVLLGITEVGERTFIGNSALLAADRRVPDGCLVAVQSVPPPEAPPGTSWLGSPPLILPRRDINRNFTETETFSPTRRLRAMRYFVEFFRVVVPSTLLALVVGGSFLAVAALAPLLPALALAGLFPAVILAAQAAALVAAAGVKVLSVGRYRPTVAPLWSMFVWRSELSTGVYEGPAAQMLLLSLTGTPFIRPAWRLFGVDVGHRVFADTTHVTEFDLVAIGDAAALNLNCGLQTHLFEDRVMKMSYLRVGAGCSVGSNSIVLYDTHMHDGSRLGALSLLMKGESLPAATAWAGIPAKRARVGVVP